MSGFPKTVDEAAMRVVAGLDEESRRRFAKMPEGELISLHRTLGQAIRNKFGLWQGNEELMRATGKDHADDASGVIIKAAWRTVKEIGDSVVIEKETEDEG